MIYHFIFRNNYDIKDVNMYIFINIVQQIIEKINASKGIKLYNKLNEKLTLSYYNIINIL